jgi:hypothetical protein
LRASKVSPLNLSAKLLTHSSLDDIQLSFSFGGNFAKLAGGGF